MRECDSFWGAEPARLVREMYSERKCNGLRVLDLGCGEGKNAAFLAERGAEVRAVDCSDRALDNARKLWGPRIDASVSWELNEASEVATQLRSESVDVVIMYGLLHCLSSRDEVAELVLACQRATAQSGVHIVCTFNDRGHDLSAHPQFQPLLLPHDFFIQMYEREGWRVAATDSNLYEAHPNNEIPHHHSMTRLVANRT